jgi:hypothetical protein
MNCITCQGELKRRDEKSFAAGVVLQNTTM